MPKGCEIGGYIQLYSINCMQKLQYVADPQMEALLKMTNDVVMKIKLQTRETHL